MLTIDFVKSYGKDMAFAVLTVLFSFVTLPIMAFDKNTRYVGPAGPEGNGMVPPAQPVSQPPVPPAPSTQSTSNGLAIASLVLGILGLFGGFTVGEVLNDYYLFRIGGIFDQNLGNFTRFSGYEFGQLGAKNMLTNINTFQFKVYKNYFINADFSIANLFNDLKVDDLIHISESSAGLTAGYKSPFGQVKLNYSRSFTNKNNIFSVILGHWF